MSQTAKIFKSGGSWAVRLPAEYRFDFDTTEVFISRTASGDVLLSTQQRPTFSGFVAYRDSLDESPGDSSNIHALAIARRWSLSRRV